jgi:hypothetical protein
MLKKKIEKFKFKKFKNTFSPSQIELASSNSINNLLDLY